LVALSGVRALVNGSDVNGKRDHSHAISRIITTPAGPLLGTGGDWFIESAFLFIGNLGHRHVAHVAELAEPAKADMGPTAAESKTATDNA
jgi:hypothetical protein